MQSRADAQESEVRTFIKEIRRYAAIEELDEAILKPAYQQNPDWRGQEGGRSEGAGGQDRV